MSLNIVRPLPWETLSSCPIAPIMDTLRGWATLVGPQAPINQNSCLDANPNNISGHTAASLPQPLCAALPTGIEQRQIPPSLPSALHHLSQIVDSDNALNNSYVPPWHIREFLSFDILAPALPQRICISSNINIEKETARLAEDLSCIFPLVSLLLAKSLLLFHKSHRKV